MLKAVMAFSLFWLMPWPAPAQPALTLIERLVQNNFSITNITWQTLQQGLASLDSSHYLLFDTRTPEEYRISHLRSAIQIDPQMPAGDFIRQYGDTLAGKSAVFYCSVGYRSSIFAQRVQREALQAGAQSVANLRGGIFRWYNEANPVVNAHGETNEIHPYDSFWEILLRQRGKRREH